MKKILATEILLGLLLLSLLITIAIPSQSQLEADLVGYWKFDEGTGTIVNDSSGYNNTGMLIGNPSWVDGKYGKALSFDGIDDYIVIPDSPSLRVQTFSLEAWIYMDKRPYQHGTFHSGIINKLHYLGGASKGYKLQFDRSTETDDHLVLSIGDGNVQIKLIEYNSINDLTLNRWHHVVGTYDGSTANLYIDGELKSSSSPGMYVIAHDDTPLVIGSEYHASSIVKFKGLIDDVRIYNRVLSIEEVKAHYLLTSPEYEKDEEKAEQRAFSDIWWNPNWTYRRRIDITENSNSSLKSFPVKVIFQHNGRAQSDGRDLRVIVDNIEIPYAIEEINQTYVAIIFQINLESNETKIAYIYYGNPEASKRNYPKVPLAILKGQNGYAIIDNSIYIGWSYFESTIPIIEWNYRATIWTDFRIDFDGNGDPADDNDLIKDYVGSYRTRIGAISRHHKYTTKVDDPLDSLGNFLGYVQTPVYVDINFEYASLRVYRNCPWVETTKADTLFMFSPSYRYANYGNGVEENIYDGITENGNWNYIYLSPKSPSWMAFKDNSGNIIASTGLRIGEGYKFVLAAKESSEWDRVIRYFLADEISPFPNEQPSECKIYWYGDKSDNYKNIEKMAQILNNQPSIKIRDEEMLPLVLIDQVYVNDNRVDVGSVQTIRFHAKWNSNSSDIVGGTIYVNGTEYVTDESGWIKLIESSLEVAKKHWIITNVNVNGVPFYNQMVDNPTIIWDRVKIELEDQRVGVGNNVIITYQAMYEYDSKPFIGSLTLNDTTFSQDFGKRGYTVVSIQDDLHGLTAFTANEAYCIFDRIKPEVKIETSIGSVQITINLNFEYDGKPVEDAFVKVNGIMAKNIGKGNYLVTLSSWMPYLTINIEVDKDGFESLMIQTSNYVLSNIILESSLIGILGIGVFLGIKSHKRIVKRRNDLKKLEELVIKKGRIDIKEASEITGVKIENIRALLSELLNKGRIKGAFTLDGNSFILEKKLKEEIKRSIVS